MDKFDLAIVDALRVDGRASNAEIARAVGVSEGTVRRRLRRLLDEDLIEIRVVTDPKGLGRAFRSVVGITAEPSLVDEILESVCELDEVTFAASTTGRYDLLVWVRVENAVDLGRFLTEKLGRIPGVRRTETHVVLGTVKAEIGQTP